MRSKRTTQQMSLMTLAIVAFGSLIGLSACQKDEFSTLIESSKSKGYHQIASPAESLPFFSRHQLNPVWDANTQVPLARVEQLKLVDHRGTSQATDLFRGKPAFVIFFFSRCTGICPMILSNLKSVEKAVGERADVKYVAISIDPERDTPADLAKYAKVRGIEDKPNWHFLTGSPKAIDDLTQNVFSLEVGKRKISGQLVHSERIFAVDKNGFVRSVLNSTENDMPEKAKKVAASLLDVDVVVK